MVRPGREQLKGPVEVDETYLGAVEEGVRGRQTERKALIVIAAEENARGSGASVWGVCWMPRQRA